MYILDPDKIKIGYVILAAVRKPVVRKAQEKAGYGASSKWTHVAGSLGGFDAVEAVMPRSCVVDLRKRYFERNIEIKLLRRKDQPDHRRYKTALWWATMNNLPYDAFRFASFPLSVACGTLGLTLHRLLGGRRRFICSELIAAGFYKEGDYLFSKPAEHVLPADFDDPELFETVDAVRKAM